MKKQRRCMYSLTYHIVFTTNYRKKFIDKYVGDFIEKTIKDICENMHGHLTSISTAPDYVHIVVELPPDTAPSTAAAVIKTQLSRHLRQEKEMIKHINQFLHADLPIWGETHFLATDGNVSNDMINEYVNEQRTDPKKRKYVKSRKYGTKRW